MLRQITFSAAQILLMALLIESEIIIHRYKLQNVKNDKNDNIITVLIKGKRSRKRNVQTETEKNE